MANQEKYTYQELQAYKKVKRIMDQDVEDPAPTRGNPGAPELTDISSATEDYIKAKKAGEPVNGLGGKAIFA